LAKAKVVATTPVAPVWTQPPPRKGVSINCGKAEDQRPRLAELLASPEMAAMRVMVAVESKDKQGFGDDLDTPSLINQLRIQASAVNSGDMKQVEAMLMNQAVALQSLFARLTERGLRCDVVQQFDVHLRLALRAQSQCCRTLETLSEIKNPPMIFARTANIANQQQINNGVMTAESRPPTMDCPKNKLSEVRHELCQDTGASAIKELANPQLEAMGAVHRPTIN
jgi:hypothetical protein